MGISATKIQIPEAQVFLTLLLVSSFESFIVNSPFPPQNSLHFSQAHLTFLAIDTSGKNPVHDSITNTTYRRP